MLRWFAGRASDALVYNPNNGRPIGSDTGTVWADEARTTQFTELLDANEDLIGSVLTTDAYGYPQMFGIDADPAVEVVWLDFTDGFGPMVRIECRDRATFTEVTPETLDPTAAALVADDGSDLSGALNADYAGVTSSRPQPRVIVIGDSIENLYSYRSATPTSVTEQFGGGDWPTYMTLLSGGSIQLVRNMGTGGETSTQYLARFDADIAPSVGPGTHNRANTVIIGAFENDIQAAIPIATSRANIVEMVRRTRVLGAVPILRTTMPHHLSAAVRKKIGAANHWVRNYGAENGILVLDFWSQVVDPTNGQYLATYSADGVHPNEAGAKLLGQYAADKIAASTGFVASTLLARDPTDTGLLAPTRLFLTDASGTPTTWNAIGGTPAGVTRSMVTDAAVPGRMARIAHVASAANVSLANNSSIINTSVASPGDTLEVSGVVTSDGGVKATVNVTIQYNDGTAKNIGRAIYFKGAVTRGGYSFRLPTLPTGFLYVLITLQADAGTGVVDFSYPTVRNLTAEGIA